MSSTGGGIVVSKAGVRVTVPDDTFRKMLDHIKTSDPDLYAKLLALLSK